MPASAKNQYRFGVRVGERGRVIGVGDGIAWVRGLPSAYIDEVLHFGDGSTGLVTQLNKDLLGAIILKQTHDITAGEEACVTGRVLEIGVGDELLGRVIDPMGNPLDGLAKATVNIYRPLESPAPPIIERDFVHKPLYTGNKIVDTLLPIGKGQRQLIIGDDATGKTSFAIDAILSQRGRHVRCVIAIIGQTRSSIASLIATLQKYNALDYTTIVVAEANALPGFRYLAPFSACSVAEHWMRQGQDTLVIYDDLTRHAQSYRELSLLLRRPPGREAYPGDIFYLHSRLLERATSLSAEAGGGSMTALPIIETQSGEIASYIPTNLISITDGQLYFDSKLFASGMLPAIDIGKSVSRIGGQAQDTVIKKEAAAIRLDYLQFLDMELFARFGTKLEKTVEEKLKRGKILRELLKQDRLSPLTAEEQLIWLTLYSEEMLDHIPIENISKNLEEIIKSASTLSLKLDAPKEKWIEEIKKIVAGINL